MRKALLCIAVLLAFGLTAVAQDTGTSGQSSTSTTTTKTTKTKRSKKAASDTSAAGETGASAAKTSTITGCIEKSGDDYMIKNGRHKKGVKVTGSDDLSAHVGHTVKLTGTWASASAASTTGTGETKGGGTKMANREFNETKVDMVSESCTTGASKSASGKKSTATTPQ